MVVGLATQSLTEARTVISQTVNFNYNANKHKLKTYKNFIMKNITSEMFQIQTLTGAQFIQMKNVSKIYMKILLSTPRSVSTEYFFSLFMLFFRRFISSLIISKYN